MFKVQPVADSFICTTPYELMEIDGYKGYYATGSFYTTEEPDNYHLEPEVIEGRAARRLTKELKEAALEREKIATELEEKVYAELDRRSEALLTEVVGRPVVLGDFEDRFSETARRSVTIDGKLKFSIFVDKYTSKYVLQGETQLLNPPSQEILLQALHFKRPPFGVEVEHSYIPAKMFLA